MFENPRRGRQARNFTTNVPKILGLKLSSEQIFYENCRWVPLRRRQSDTSIAFKLLGWVRARTALSLIRFIKIIFSSCLSKARSKAVQFSHKRLYSVFNIARTAYTCTNRYVLIISQVAQAHYESREQHYPT